MSLSSYFTYTKQTKPNKIMSLVEDVYRCICATGQIRFPASGPIPNDLGPTFEEGQVNGHIS